MYPPPPPNPYIQNQQGQFNSTTGMYEFQSNYTAPYGAPPPSAPVAGQSLNDAPPRYDELPQSDLPPYIASSVPEKKMIKPHSLRNLKETLLRFLDFTDN